MTYTPTYKQEMQNRLEADVRKQREREAAERAEIYRRGQALGIFAKGLVGGDVRVHVLSAAEKEELKKVKGAKK